ncbi:MAG: LiaF transmembrane domain-containing protein [Armatimonadota bacterium]
MPTRYLIGLILLLLGVGFLLDQFYPGLNLVAQYWPALLILAGLNELIRRPRNPWWAIVLLVVGALVLYYTLDQGARLNAWVVIGAALLIGLGLRLLIPQRPRSSSAPVRTGGETVVRSDDQLNQSVSFGGAKVRSISRAFRGGRVSVAFGGAEIDLREANLSPDGAELRLDAVFGGIELRVPVGWPVQVSGAPALGATEVHIQNTEIVVDGAGLRVICSGIFSGIEIKN